MDEKDLLKAGTEIACEVGKEVVKQGYQDISPAVKESSKTIQLLSSFVNEVIFNKMQNSILERKYKREAFERDLQKRYDAIPIENRIEPPLHIVGPTIEALKYTIDVEDLREMYLNLLTSSMDSEKQSNCHPSFSEIIRQMTSVDALMLQKCVELRQFSAPKILFNIVGKDKHFSNAMPIFFVEEMWHFADPFLVSSSLSNLIRLGILENQHSFALNTFNQDKIKQNGYVLSRFEEYQKWGKDLGEEVEINMTPNTVSITDFGNSFAKVCIQNSELN